MRKVVVFEKTVHLPASPRRVLGDLIEPSHVPEYDSRMRRWQPRDIPMREGTRIDFEAKLGPLWTHGVSEVTYFDPPHRLSLRLVSPPSPFRSQLTWSLTEHDDGTAFEYRFVMSCPRGLVWLGRRLLGAFTAHLVDELPALADRYR